jgi:hypothetical protein
MSGNLSDLSFDAKAVEPSSGFDLLPPGDYEVAIVSSDTQNTKAGTGKMVNLELQVLVGKFKGRKLFDRLNLWNPSAKAVEIARGTLSAICRAVGVLTPNDTSDLHNRPLVVKVVITKDPQYGDKNEVKAYKPRTAVQAAMAETRQTLANPPAYVKEDDLPF